MPEITPALVGQLRAMTGAGLMNCKKALDETKGDLQAAVDILRKQGAAAAVKKADRAANEGLIGQAVVQGGRVGVLIEVNCETDFVARNDSFKAFVGDLAVKVANEPGVDLEADRVGAVARIGENIQVRRHQRLEVQGQGLVAAYIHTGGKVGVLVEVGATKEATTGHEEFKQLVRDITLQIAAASPVSISRTDVAADLVEKEKEIAAQSEAVKGKPVAEVRALVHRFKSMMSIEDATDDPAVAAVKLGDLEALQGVVKFPVRIKCAVLAWNTLTEALDQSATA